MGVVEYQNYMGSNSTKHTGNISAINTQYLKEEEHLKELIYSGKLSNRVGMYWHMVTE